MKFYKLIVYSENFKQSYDVLASTLQNAKMLTYSNFKKAFPNESSYKVALEPTDLKNHLDEFLNIIYAGDDKNVTFTR